MAVQIQLPSATYKGLASAWAHREPHANVFGEIDSSKGTRVVRNELNTYVIPPSVPMSQLQGSSQYVWMPATFTTASAPQTGTEIDVSNPQPFTAGDAVYVEAPMARLALAGTWAVSDTYTLTLQDVAFVHTATSTTISTIVSEATNQFNADPAFNSKYIAYAQGTSQTVISRNFLTPSTVAGATSGSGTVTVQDSLTSLKAYQSVGTIAASGVDVPGNKLTFTANVGVPLGGGLPIGTRNNPVGVTGDNEIDILGYPADFVAFTRGQLFKGRMLYWDDRLTFGGQIIFI